MAGGKGTRIAGVRSDIPKPLIPVCEKPVLQWQIECLVQQGLTHIVLVVGHLARAIMDYFGDGSRFGAHITYVREETPLGTAGALALIRTNLTEDFLLLNGDAMLDVDFRALLDAHRAAGVAATIATHPNSHPYDSAIVVPDERGLVRAWYHKEDKRPACRNCVNAGVHVLSPRAIDALEPGKPANLDADVLAPLVGTGQLLAYHTTEYIKDMGTPERYAQVCAEVADGLPARRRLSVSQRAIFIDRDGTINRHVGYVTHPAQLELLPHAAEAIRKLNDAGWLVIVVTNQPVIARGDCSWEELDRIHATLEELLGKQGAYVDDIYVCPHHPDKGFEGERPKYKVRCSCRKPEPGLILFAAERYNIDVARSWMVGDDWRDEGAGKAAGCNTFVVGRDGSLADFCARVM